MLSRLYVDNYKCLVNFELRFKELTLLLGPNGSGKSSVLDVVYAVRQLLSGRAKVTDPDVLPAATLTRWQRNRVQVVEMEFQFPDEEEPLTYRLEVEQDPERGWNRRRIRVVRAPSGRGAGDRFVLGQVPNELAWLRRRGAAAVVAGAT